jgi:hypothetical protein
MRAAPYKAASLYMPGTHETLGPEARERQAAQLFVVAMSTLSWQLRVGASSGVWQVMEGETSWQQSKVGGFAPAAGAVVGQAAGFVVQARDANGNNRTRGGDSFDVQLTGRGGAALSTDVTVEDMHDGACEPLWEGVRAGAVRDSCDEVVLPGEGRL